MEQAKQRIFLNIRQNAMQQHVSVKQGDTAFTLQAVLSNGERAAYPISQNSVVSLQGKTPAGHPFVVPCQKIGDSEVSCEISSNLTAVPGDMECELVINDANDRQITAQKFVIEVKETAGNGIDLTQVPEFPIFDLLLSQASQAQQQADILAQQYETLLQKDPTQGPQGEKGEKGDKGEQGDIGPQGPAGPQGPQGLQGEKGEQGPQGLLGPQGVAGYTPKKGVDYWTSADKQEILDQLNGTVAIPLTQQGYMEGGNGWNSLNTAQTDARNSGWVAIPQGYTHISATLRINKYGWAVLFATGNGTGLILDSTVSVLGGETNLSADYFVEIPSNAQYVMVSTYLYEGTSACFTKAESNTDHETTADILDRTEFALFKQWGVVGDSLSVGHTADSDGNASSPNLDYSWGQYLARRLGNTCLHFGRSGVSAKEWMTTEKGYPALVKPENLCQCYILALGANDTEFPLGSIDDIDFSDMTNNADTEYGHYAKVIHAIRTTAPKAPIFLFTLPYPRNTQTAVQAINQMIRELATNENFSMVYLVDLDAHYNHYFKEGKLGNCIGNTGWHLTALGYLYASIVNEMAISKVMAENYADFQDVFELPYGTPPKTTTTEEWVFELEDGSTVTKEVMLV